MISDELKKQLADDAKGYVIRLLEDEYREQQGRLTSLKQRLVQRKATPEDVENIKAVVLELQRVLKLITDKVNK